MPSIFPFFLLLASAAAADREYECSLAYPDGSKPKTITIRVLGKKAEVYQSPYLWFEYTIFQDNALGLVMAKGFTDGAPGLGIQLGVTAIILDKKDMTLSWSTVVAGEERFYRRVGQCTRL